MSQYRTHTCGELRAADAGKTVTLAGWMENVREVGSNFAFVVLRDFYGTTQIVVDSAEMMKTVKGKGISFMENNAGWHGKAPNDEEYAVAMEDLRKEGEALCQK